MNNDKGNAETSFRPETPITSTRPQKIGRVASLPSFLISARDQCTKKGRVTFATLPIFCGSLELMRNHRPSKTFPPDVVVFKDRIGDFRIKKKRITLTTCFASPDSQKNRRTQEHRKLLKKSEKDFPRHYSIKSVELAAPTMIAT